MSGILGSQGASASELLEDDGPVVQRMGMLLCTVTATLSGKERYNFDLLCGAATFDHL